MKSIKKLTIAILAFGIGSITVVFAGGTTGPCTPPEGKIEIQPSQKCNGKYTVAIGKTLTLKAVSLKDKDCYCGRGVQDTINTETGVRWSVGGGIGTLHGGTDGTPKEYTAPPTTHVNLAVRLQVNDEANSPETYDDGGFIQVASLNLDVVIPNKGSTVGSAETQCPSPVQSGSHGRWRSWSTTVARNGCTVDFDGLVVNESGCDTDDFGCGAGMLAGSNNPASDSTLASNTATNPPDITGACDTVNYTPPVDCVQTRYCNWSIKASGGLYIDWGRFYYTFSWPHAGGIDSATNTRAWSSAL